MIGSTWLVGVDIALMRSQFSPAVENGIALVAHDWGMTVLASLGQHEESLLLHHLGD
ncbi:MAG: hypothetical protein KGN01_06765 [Patescibacteria group bacterium]|nr:hypothetical protein [Patescibacteria group bacterium]